MSKKLIPFCIAILLLLTACKTQQVEEDYILAPENFDEFLITYGDILEIDSFENTLELENYKDNLNWVILNDYSNNAQGDLSKKCEISNKWSSEGLYSLKCDFRESSNVDETTASFVFPKKINTFWKNAKFFAVIIHNPNMDCIRIAAGIENFTSEAYICPPGDHLLLIDVTDYANTLKDIPDTNTVNSIFLKITDIDKLTSKSDSFYFDNLRLIMDNSKQIQTSDQIPEFSPDTEENPESAEN